MIQKPNANIFTLTAKNVYSERAVIKCQHYFTNLHNMFTPEDKFTKYQLVKAFERDV